MKSILVSLFLTFVLFDSFSQEIALTTEITNRNGVVYHKGSPFTGDLYEYNENAKTSCNCTKKYTLTNGMKDGKAFEWYVTGQKKFEGLFDNGKKEGKHTYWTATGLKEVEETFYKDKQSSIKTYYRSGKVKEYKEYEISGGNSFLKRHEQFLDNSQNTLVKQYNYINQGRKHGEQKEFYDNGNPKLYEKYNNGKLLDKVAYSPENKVLSKVTTKNNLSFVEEFYDTGNVKETGFYLNGVKDSVWTFYDTTNQKIKEEAYKNNKLTRTGSFNKNQKNGEWNYYFSDGETQKIENYDNGTLLDSRIFKTSHLIGNFFPDSKRHLFTYKPNENINEFIIIEGDNSTNNKKINDKIIEEFSKRLNKEVFNAGLKNETISKIVKIQNINVTFKEDTYQISTGQYEKGYDAFINFKLLLFNADDVLLSQENFKINKSDKLLNSLFNAVAKTYARSREIAFNNSLKQLDLTDFLIKHFPLETDEENKKKKKKKLT